MEKKHYCDCLDFLQKMLQSKLKYRIKLKPFMKTKNMSELLPSKIICGLRHWCLMYPKKEKSVVAPFQSTINSGFCLRRLHDINFCCYPFIELIDGVWLSVHWTDSRCVAIHTLNWFKVGSYTYVEQIKGVWLISSMIYVIIMSISVIKSLTAI